MPPWQAPAWESPPVNDDTELHLGPVRGYRWWTLAAPCLDEWPLDDVMAAWEPGWLHATNRSEWLPGVNVATCASTYAAHPKSNIPANDCGCGYWAYHQPQHHKLPGGRLPVFGAIDATGDIIIGENMLRAAKAEIVALHLPLTIGPGLPPSDDLGTALARNPRFTGKVCTYPGVDREFPPLLPSPEEIAEAELRGEAWMAVIGDRLRQLYPAAEVCETRDLLLASYPPDAEYGHMRACQWCRERAVPYGHEYACQANPFRGSTA
jgi:hypothetical protein